MMDLLNCRLLLFAVELDSLMMIVKVQTHSTVNTLNILYGR